GEGGVEGVVERTGDRTCGGRREGDAVRLRLRVHVACHGALGPAAGEGLGQRVALTGAQLDGVRSASVAVDDVVDAVLTLEGEGEGEGFVFALRQTDLGDGEGGVERV